jgi:hypothetical protein
VGVAHDAPGADQHDRAGLRGQQGSQWTGQIHFICKNSFY